MLHKGVLQSKEISQIHQQNENDKWENNLKR